jgi:hypothetical protein
MQPEPKLTPNYQLQKGKGFFSAYSYVKVTAGKARIN